MELYPPQGDALRAEFAREHARHMPPHETCMQMNDPCKPELYDEDIEFVDGDRGSNPFEFTVHRDASHATSPGQPPESVESAAALYRYAWNGQSWTYCEEGLPDKTRNGGQGCTPNLPVKPDTSNADFSPFDRRVHQ
jgi:hypothetical protein